MARYEISEQGCYYSQQLKEKAAQMKAFVSKTKDIAFQRQHLDGHKTYYRPSQVERSIPCYGTEVKVGTRMAMLYPIQEGAFDDITEPMFFPGTVTRVFGGYTDMMEFTYDGGPNGALGMVCGIAEYSKFCIPVPKDYEEARAHMLHSKTKTKPHFIHCIDCGAKAHAKNLCNKHYKRMRSNLRA